FASRRPRHPPPHLFPYTTLFRSARPGSGVPRLSARRGRLRVVTTPDKQARRRRRRRTVALRWGTRLVVAAVLFGVGVAVGEAIRSEEHTSELQSRFDLVCRLLLE